MDLRVDKASCIRYPKSYYQKRWEFLLRLSGVRTRHSVPEDAGSIPGLIQWMESELRIWCCHSCRVGHRCRSDLALLWLWYRLAAASSVQPLAWGLPYATGVALKRKNKKERYALNHIKIQNFVL